MSVALIKKRPIIIVNGAAVRYQHMSLDYDEAGYPAWSLRLERRRKKDFFAYGSTPPAFSRCKSGREIIYLECI